MLDVDPRHCNAWQQQAGHGNGIADEVANNQGQKGGGQVERCTPTPQNQNKRQTHNKKCQYKAHHNDAHYTMTSMNCALALIHQSQVRTRCQPQARAKPMRMRTIIFMLIRNWSQVAMCLASLTINSIGASPIWVKRLKKEKCLLYSWTTISILQMPSQWGSIPWMQTSIGLMTSRIHLILN